MAIVLAVLLVALVLMWLGWRARKRRQAAMGSPLAVPADLGSVNGTFEGLYVATTVADSPLDRIAVRGLGFRSRAEVSVAPEGVVLALRGQDPVFIPASDLRAVTRATWTIDRVVEDGGLVLVAWTLGTGPDARDIDSYFRLPDSQPLISAITDILPAPTGRKA
jgi:hypothetical protein